MTRKANDNEKRMPVFAAILALAAVLFLLTSGSAVPALQGAAGEARTVTGKIIGVDASHATKSLTLQSFELGLSPPNNELNIFVTDKTAVQMCYSSGKSLKDLKTGGGTQVTYHEIAGLAVADFIYKPC